VKVRSLGKQRLPFRLKSKALRPAKPHRIRAGWLFATVENQGLVGTLFQQLDKIRQVNSSGPGGRFRQRKVNASLGQCFSAPNGSINSDWLVLR